MVVYGFDNVNMFFEDLIFYTFVILHSVLKVFFELIMN